MAGFRSPLDAYREDLSRANGRKRFASGDEFWIILATGLRRLAHEHDAGRPPAARRLASILVAFAKQIAKLSTPEDGTDERGSPMDAARAEAVADALARYPEAEDAALLVRHVRATAADAEEAGAVELAREILTDLRDLSSHAQPLDRGLVLIQLARVARTLGELDAAQDLLRAAGDLARATGTRELEVRVAAADAVLAHTRGNYPAARRLFETALAGASELALSDVAGLAHHGLMVVTAEAGEFDVAVHHGWLALSAARTEGTREAEAFCNLAQLCAKAGYDDAALGGFTTALGLTMAPRIRLPSLAGVATAAGRLGDARRLELAEQAIVREASDAFPFETAGAWLALARAKRAMGDGAAGEAAAKKAAAIAHHHGFFEIAHYLHQDAQSAPAPLAEPALRVIRSLEAWSSDHASELAFTNTSTVGSSHTHHRR
jgi:hypothetical protein